ncbi:tetrachloroethene reductive dehalogenase PceA [Photobacterium aphoticum]|uniref:Tetrachloroethene reductive dehalogenase PceA n=1 Tax=Photobacterium aphoticum TaxID=754436 RepID=A0A090R8W6_9GAMM|nr:tetrachloroethene reductive dehalogenase PceA [Photobacterium aphoticum]
MEKQPTPTSDTDNVTLENPQRRNLFKWGAAATALAATGGAGAFVTYRVNGVPHDGFPVEIDDSVLIPFDQRNSVFSYAISQALQEQFPERNTAFAAELGIPGFTFSSIMASLKKHAQPNPSAWDNETLGYRQIDWALCHAAVGPLDRYLAPTSKFGSPRTGEHTWDQWNLATEQWQFESPEDASQHIKRAACLFGADRVGITHNDPRWNYSPIFDPVTSTTYTWEDDFPFKPKTVIVLAFEMDYEAIRTAPSAVSAASVNNEYTEMSLVAGQLADFIRRLGYQAVASGNDLGNNVAYSIAAGLGEGARNGTLIVPNFGSRVRTAKVYTDLDFVEYDKARSFGIMEFCENCKRCAEQCPSNAISMDDKPSMAPTYPGSESIDIAWHGQKGVRKFYNDAKKCFKYWGDNGIGCVICIKACPWNKPDFWHHRLIDASNTVTTGFVHKMMTEADILFGYGNMEVDKAVDKFWLSDKEK